MIDEIIAKLRELNLVSSSTEPIDAEFYLNELNAQFIHLCEEFTLLSEEEQESGANRSVYYGAQQTFHSAGAKLIRRIFDPTAVPEPTEQEGEVVVINNDVEQQVVLAENELQQTIEQPGVAEIALQQPVENKIVADVVQQPTNENITPEQQPVDQNVVIEQSQFDDADVVIMEELVVQSMKQDSNQSEPMIVEGDNKQYTEKDGAVGGLQIQDNASAGNLPIASTSTFVQPQAPAKELPKTVLPYKKYLYLMMPIYALQPILHVNADAINAILGAIEQMQERARRENFSLEQLQLMIIGYVHHLMDPTSQTIWMWQIEDTQPTFDVLIEFLLKRSRTMEPDSAESSTDGQGTSKKKRKVCQKCGSDHFLHRCPAFLILNVQQRRKVINELRLCHNCFSSLHTTNQCSVGPCKACAPNKHNSLVCLKNNQNR